MKLTQFVLTAFALFLCFFIAPSALVAQTPRNINADPIHSPHISFTAGGFIPMGDLNDRYGAFATVGASFGVKTENNGYLGFRATSLSGARCHQEGLLSNLLTEDNEIIDNEGDVAWYTVSGRGAIIGFHAGKVFNNIISLPSSNPNSGILVRGGIGYIHHKIRFDFTENRITQLEDPYVQGYDRLAAGFYTSNFIGYWHMDDARRINYYAGIYSFASRTYPMRNYNYDTNMPDTEPRFDMGVGFELGWVLHIYKRTPKEYWY